MYYTTFLMRDKNMVWRATVPALPDCHVDAPTRAEAIKKIQERVAQVITHVEVLQLPLPANGKMTNGAAETPDQTPWEWFGVFQNDPSWGELFTDIEKQRDAHVIEG